MGGQFIEGNKSDWLSEIEAQDYVDLMGKKQNIIIASESSTRGDVLCGNLFEDDLEMLRQAVKNL